MAEALGIFCGSLQLLDKLVKLSDVATSVMDAPDEMAALARDLGDLKLLFDTKVKDLPKEGLAVLKEPIGHFENDLETIMKDLKKLDLKKTKRIRWAVSKSKECSQAAGRLEKYKSLFELAISGDSREVGKKTHEIMDSLKEDVQNLDMNLAETKRELLARADKGISKSDEISRDIAVLKKQKMSEEVENARASLVSALCQFDFKTTQQDMFAAHQKGTGEWLLRDERFEKWLQEKRSILFCPGIPGAGKSVLSSLVVDVLKGLGRTLQVPGSIPTSTSSTGGKTQLSGVSFVYCNYKETGLTAQKLLENIIGQLLAQIESKELSEKHLKELESWRPEMRTNEPETFKKAYGRVAEYFGRTFIIVDALDEFAEGEADREKFVSILRSFSLVSNVSILVTSRPIADIEDLFANDIRIEISASDADLGIFIRERMDGSNHGRLPRIVKNNEALQEQILEKVIGSAKGMFLLAKLQMDSLSDKQNVKGIRVALNNLPQKLNAIYDEAIKRIHLQQPEDRDLALSILTWMTFALRPFSITELQFALAISPGDKELDEEALIDEKIMLGVCSGLVTIDDKSRIMRLVHYTVQEYLEGKKSSLHPKAESLIAQTCLTCMSFPRWDESFPWRFYIMNSNPELISTYFLKESLQARSSFDTHMYNMFLRYAFEEGWTHLKRVQSEQIVLNELLQILQSESCRQFLSFYIDPKMEETRSLIYGGFEMYHSGIRRFPSALDYFSTTCRESDVGECDFLREFRNRKSLAELELREHFFSHLYSPSIRRPQSALLIATYYGLEKVIAALLEGGADPNEKSADDWNITPLFCAILRKELSGIPILAACKATNITRGPQFCFLSVWIEFWVRRWEAQNY